MLREIGGRANHDEAKGVRETHLHHVSLDRLAESNTRVVALRDDVHEALLDDHFDVDAGMACPERGENRVDHERDRRTGNR